MKKESPILFSTDMVQAILNGSKTKTRRVVNSRNCTGFGIDKTLLDFTCIYDNSPFGVKVPQKEYGNDDLKLNWRGTSKLGKKGDLLWVRENFGFHRDEDGDYVAFMADFAEDDSFRMDTKWKPSIHMPKAACRIWLEITDVRVERLQDISEADAMAEGVVLESEYQILEEWKEGWRNYILPDESVFRQDTAKESFETLWDSINGKPKEGKPDVSWNANPWVWVYSFKVISTTGKP